MNRKCFFECENTSTNLINCGSGRIATIRKCSIRRKDGLIKKLDGLDSIKCHKNCVSTYASDLHIKRFLSKQEHAEEIPRKKKLVGQLCLTSSSKNIACFVVKSV